MLLLIFLTTFIFGADEQKIYQVPALKELSAKFVIRHLYDSPEIFLNKNESHGKKNDELIDLALGKLSTDVAEDVLNSIQLIEHPELEGLRDIAYPYVLIRKPFSDTWHLRSLKNFKQPIISSKEYAYDLKMTIDYKYIIMRSIKGLSIHDIENKSEKLISKNSNGFCLVGNKNILYLDEGSLKKINPELGKEELIMKNICNIAGFLKNTNCVLVEEFIYGNSCLIINLNDNSKKLEFSLFPGSKILALGSPSKECEFIAYRKNKKINLFQIAAGLKLLLSIDVSNYIAQDALIDSAVFDPTCRYLAVGTNLADHGVYIFDITNYKTNQDPIISRKIPYDYPICKLRWDHNLFCTDGDLRFYSLRTSLLIKIKEYLDRKTQSKQ